MKTTHVIREMQQTQKNAETALRQDDNQGAFECYQKALRLIGQLPEDAEFDRRRFEASCQAGLSGVLGKLDKHMESFAAANKALTFYDSLGELAAEDVGRFLMAQVNQGTALAALGCLPAALEALQRAKDVFRQKGLDTETNRSWLDAVDGNIEAINREILKEAAVSYAFRVELNGILQSEMFMEYWRYLPISTNNPAMNMAIDEAILTARVSEKVPNTLRLYCWHPSAVSIGRNQAAEEWVYLENCQKLGVEVVRRCSGGGAVYHDSEGEVTYCVSANVASLGNSGDITAVYQKIYGAVTDALRLLGVPADFNGGDAKNCPNLSVGGKKISGSSQNLTRGYVLQHGTVLRNVDIDKMFQLLKLKDATCSQAADIARNKITSVQNELGHKISPDTIANALAQGFKAILKIQLQEGSLTSYESELAEILYEDKYSTKEWTLSGKTI